MSIHVGIAGTVPSFDAAPNLTKRSTPKAAILLDDQRDADAVSSIEISLSEKALHSLLTVVRIAPLQVLWLACHLLRPSFTCPQGNMAGPRIRWKAWIVVAPVTKVGEEEFKSKASNGYHVRNQLCGQMTVH